MDPVVKPERGVDQNENPPCHHRRRFPVLEDQAGEEHLQSNDQLRWQGNRFLELFAPLSMDLVDESLEARVSHFGARHSQPLADPADRILEGRQNCRATPLIGEVNGVFHDGHYSGWINSEALSNSPLLKLFPIPNILTDRSEATSFDSERLQPRGFCWLQPCAFGRVIDRCSRAGTLANLLEPQAPLLLLPALSFLNRSDFGAGSWAGRPRVDRRFQRHLVLHCASGPFRPNPRRLSTTVAQISGNFGSDLLGRSCDHRGQQIDHVKSEQHLI